MHDPGYDRREERQQAAGWGCALGTGCAVWLLGAFIGCAAAGEGIYVSTPTSGYFGLGNFLGLLAGGLIAALIIWWERRA